MATSTGLNIVKASAGSGKTYRLVGEYLKMLFARPMSYRNILAVTFTNKATAEMKERILKELASLSNGGESKYIDFLGDFGSEQKIRAKAPLILKLILHDYSRFSVMTIDSFFQKIIRSFAREIRLNASFRTEIDNRQALEDAVDLLFQEIDSNLLLKSWMVQFLEENLEDGRSWDFKKELLKFGKEIEKETFKVHGDELLDSLEGKEQLGLYIGEMKEIVRQADTRLRQYGQEGLQLISANGLTFDQFKGGKASFANHFNKLATGKFEAPSKSVMDACDNPEVWYKKTDTHAIKARIEEVYHKGLNNTLKNSIKALTEEIMRLNSAEAILKNIFPFGLLGNIALKMKEVLAESNTVLLSDSGRMIGKIIDGNDTPFIYEKVGSVFRHFMLDEFQDTSRQQWTNFRPLVDNALASGNSSLVVGDIKQSIYRWRNGDWNLLASQLQSDLGHQEIVVEELDVNWRSKKNIVDFNNTLFWNASSYLENWFLEQTKESQISGLEGVIATAYEGQCQKISQTGIQKGYVRISFTDPDGGNNKKDFREKALVILIDQLERVQQSGVKAEEITILVRENAEAEIVAKALWEKKKCDPVSGCIYDVITSDTLKIGNSPVVRFVVNFFRFFARKETQLARAELLYGYYKILLPLMDLEDKTLSIELHELFDSSSEIPEMFSEWLEEDSSAAFLNSLLALPLYELAVAIADHFHLGSVTGEKSYLQSFFDMIIEYGKEDSGGIQGFLEWWEASGCKKTLNLPTIRNFIRISSIHQSKGLEYHTVFIPFCNWEVAINTHKIPFLWSVPQSEPFNRMKMVLLKCDSSLKNSVFSQDYYHELLLSIMDNLNLLYVALTRAINNLFIILPYKEGNRKLGTVADLIQTLIENPMLPDSIDSEKYMDFGKHWEPVSRIFESGVLPTEILTDISQRQEQKTEPLLLHSNSNRMEIRMHSKDYFRLTGDSRSERINKGTVMHQIFENITTGSDVEMSIRQIVASGLITHQEGEEIGAKIEELLRQEPFCDWFGDQWKVLNERDILRAGESKHRPDRVMLKDGSAIVLDYKTGEKSDKDLRQMKGYLSDLKKMGYSFCEGNIWYLQNNEIVKVE